MKTEFLQWFEARFGPRPKIPEGLPARTDLDLYNLSQQGAKAQVALNARTDYDATLAACKAGFESKV
jgi:hypothetical protein